MTQNLNDERLNDLGSLFDDVESRYVLSTQKIAMSTTYCCTLYFVPTRCTGTYSLNPESWGRGQARNELNQTLNSSTSGFVCRT